jgi:hypothetical protein
MNSAQPFLPFDDDALEDVFHYYPINRINILPFVLYAGYLPSFSSYTKEVQRPLSMHSPPPPTAGLVCYSRWGEGVMFFRRLRRDGVKFERFVFTRLCHPAKSGMA